MDLTQLEVGVCNWNLPLQYVDGAGGVLLTQNVASVTETLLSWWVQHHTSTGLPAAFNSSRRGWSATKWRSGTVEVCKHAAVAAAVPKASVPNAADAGFVNG